MDHVNFGNGSTGKCNTYNIWSRGTRFILETKYSLSNMQVGLLRSAVNIGPLFCMLFAGRLLDRYNERILIGASTVLLGGALLLAHMARGFIGLLFVLLLIGTFYSVSQPGGK